MKFSKKKKSKMRKKRFEHNKREWSNYYLRDIDGKKVIDKISIGQTLYLLAEGEHACSIYKVGAKGELSELSPKKILCNRGAFQKTKKWCNKTKVKINNEGVIASVERKAVPYISRFIIIIEA